MITKPRLGPDHPLVQAAFSGIYKSSQKMHFRINPETGNHEKVGVCKALAGVNITYENKMDLVQSFPFPSLAYSSPSKQALALAKTSKKLKPVRAVAADRGVRPSSDSRIESHGFNTDEEDIDDEAEPDDQPMGGKKCQFSLVQQGPYWGCYDGREGTVVLFKTLQQAREYIEDLLHGRDGFRSFYRNKVRS